jgi:hypothetical protein
MLLAGGARTREVMLTTLGVGLRTFYRELELLHRCGVKVQHREKTYHLHGTAAEAEGKLPFPDPQLSFAEMAELAQSPGPAGRRLGELLQAVINLPAPAKRRARGGPKKSGE